MYMSTSKIRNKTISRIAAIQVLYQYDQNNRDQSIELLIQSIINFYQNKDINSDLGLDEDKSLKIKPSVSHLDNLVQSTIDNLTIIDQIISDHLIDKWDTKNNSPLLLALLRVSTCEIKFFPDVPTKVIINEFTDIASEMLSESEIGFVNSILDNISKLR